MQRSTTAFAPCFHARSAANLNAYRRLHSAAKFHQTLLYVGDIGPPCIDLVSDLIRGLSALVVRLRVSRHLSRGALRTPFQVETHRLTFRQRLEPVALNRGVMHE
jgi:hypothetical protein